MGSPKIQKGQFQYGKLLRSRCSHLTSTDWLRVWLYWNPWSYEPGFWTCLSYWMVHSLETPKSMGLFTLVHFDFSTWQLNGFFHMEWATNSSALCVGVRILHIFHGKKWVFPCLYGVLGDFPCGKQNRQISRRARIVGWFGPFLASPDLQSRR